MRGFFNNVTTVLSTFAPVGHLRDTLLGSAELFRSPSGVPRGSKWEDRRIIPTKRRPDMQYGRLNVIVGGIALFVATVGGFALGFTLDPFFERGSYELPFWRFLLRAGHTHGMPFSFYNIIIGILVGQLVLTDKWKRVCSVCAALALLMPIGLVLRGLTGGTTTFVPVVLLGSFFFLASAAIVISGAIRPGSSGK